MKLADHLVIRPLQRDDLEAVNAIIESCVMGWNLPERVKRLVLGSYRYNPHDLAHFDICLGETTDGRIVGVAALEEAAPPDLPTGQSGLLLHGLYVDPAHQHQGIGRRLLAAALASVRQQHKEGLLVKAQADASGFFRAQGFIDLPVENENRDYPHRWWKPV